MNMIQKKTDVIIPVYKPDDRTLLLIKKLLKQTSPIHEIHIINTECGTFPGEFSKFPPKVRVTHIKKKEFDHGGTRHRAAMESSADILVFMTQDALPANDRLIEELIRPLNAESDVAASYARQLPEQDCNIIEKYTRSFNYPAKSCTKSIDDLEHLGVKTYFCSDVCAAYKKPVYESLGGFDETIFNEDMIMAAKMIQSGAKVAYAAEAMVIHSHNYTCIQQFRRNFDMAVSQTQHPEVFQEVSSENEGIRLVKDTAAYLMKIRKPWLLFSLIVKSGFKYMGYRCGKKYEKLPARMREKMSASPEYWKKQKN